MSILVILASSVLISNNMNVVSGLFLRPQLVWSTAKNSVLSADIVYQGPIAEVIYVMERSDQTKKVETLKKKIQNRNQQKKAEQSADIKSVDDELEELDRKAKKNKFCSETMMGNICQRAFKNVYFSKNKWTLEAIQETECGLKDIFAEKDGKTIEYKRELVKCNIKNEKGGRAFLEESTRYASGNLKYFVMSDESGKLRPVAFLMNKPEPKAPKKTKESKETKEPKGTKNPKSNAPSDFREITIEGPDPEPKAQKNPKSKEVPASKEIPITDVSVSTTAVPITSVGAGYRQAPVSDLI